MTVERFILSVVAAALLAMPAYAAENDSKAFDQFQQVLEGIEARSFERVQESMDQTDLYNRIVSIRPVGSDIRDIFGSNFWSMVSSNFETTLPPAGSNIDPELVEFVFEDGRGRAAVRYQYPGYDYRFVVYELQHNSRGRLRVVDWFNASAGQTLAAWMSDMTLTLKPTNESVRRLVSIESPTDLQLFRFTEILKAFRDGQAPRFFEIYDSLDEASRSEPFMARFAASMAFRLKDMDRFSKALEIFENQFGDEANFAMLLSQYFLVMQDLDSTYRYLKKFHGNFSINEGAIPARLSAIALATGASEEAEQFALEATRDEPGLELGWWSLLRARTAAADYTGATEALSRLEDDFSLRLDEAKLRRDRYRAFGKLVESQAYKDWRAGRP